MWDGTVLDGELIAARFAGTMAALHGSRRHRDHLRRVVFDAPFLAGVDLSRLPWQDRRERLELLAQGFEPLYELSPVVTPDPLLAQAMIASELKRLVSKDRTSTHRDGSRVGCTKVKDSSWYAREAWRFERQEWEYLEMPEPIVFISHFRIKEGNREAYVQLAREMTPKLAAEKPSTLVFLSYENEPGDRISIVHAFADADGMDRHFQGAAERGAAAMEFLEPAGWDIYGQPSPAALEQMGQLAARTNVPLTVEPRYVGGFLRLHDANAIAGRA